MDEEQYQMIKKNVAQFRKWRLANPGERIDLESALLAGLRLGALDLAGANLKRANLQGVILEQANLEKVNLEGANLHGANLRSANIINANLSGADLSGIKAQGTVFMGSNLKEANFYQADLSNANLMNTNAEKANFLKADLSNTMMMNAKVKGADLSADKMKDAVFSKGNLDSTQAELVIRKGAKFGKASSAVLVLAVKALIITIVASLVILASIMFVTHVYKPEIYYKHVKHDPRVEPLKYVHITDLKIVEEGSQLYAVGNLKNDSEFPIYYLSFYVDKRAAGEEAVQMTHIPSRDLKIDTIIEAPALKTTPFKQLIFYIKPEKREEIRKLQPYNSAVFIYFLRFKD